MGRDGAVDVGEYTDCWLGKGGRRGEGVCVVRRESGSQGSRDGRLTYLINHRSTINYKTTNIFDTLKTRTVPRKSIQIDVCLI